MKFLEITQSWIDEEGEPYKHVFITDSDGRGNVTVELSEDEEGKHIGYIANLWVKEECRNGGIANALLVRVEEVAKSDRCEYAVLDWALRNSPEWVLNWYVSKGYKMKEYLLKDDDFGHKYARLIKHLSCQA